MEALSRHDTEELSEPLRVDESQQVRAGLPKHLTHIAARRPADVCLGLYVGLEFGDHRGKDVPLVPEMHIELALRYLGPPRDLGSAGDLEAAFEKRLSGSVEDACAAIGSCGTSLFSHIWKLFLEFAIRRKNDARRKICKDRIRSIAPARRLQARSFPAACPGFRPETRGWTSRSKHNDRGERSR